MNYLSNIFARFANAKSACLGRKSTSTGLYKHFSEGCPTHLQTGDMRHVTITLLDHMDTSQEKLDDAGHAGGVQCRCNECEKGWGGVLGMGGGRGRTVVSGSFRSPITSWRLPSVT